MKKFMVLAVLVTLTDAGARPLLGTADSFVESGYCRKYTCTFEGKTDLGANVAQYSYVVGKLPANFNPMRDYDDRLSVTIYRINNKVISGTFGYGAQDSLFYPNTTGLGKYLDFVGLLSGKTPSAALMSKIEGERCGIFEERGQAIVTPHGNVYTISCLNSSGQNSRILKYSIYKP